MDYTLARLPIFRRLPREALESLGDVFLPHPYVRGEAIFDEGSKADAVFLLKTGLVKAVKHSPRAEPVIMQLIAPGHLFGMMGVMDRKDYPVSAICVHDSEAYRIRAADFSDLLKRHPAFSAEVFAEMGAHVRQGQELRALAKEPAERKIAFVLALLARDLGPELSLRREEIAEIAVTTTETAIRVLARLREDKLIAARWKRITILDARALERFAQGARP
ncbi:MAG: Crp/Fnr family transcriptional regulator [Elusimicrobia bacterium]|nr:Crp/Fnr family transcriptional regulator [Elusimicrobiota bacterium]